MRGILVSPTQFLIIAIVAAGLSPAALWAWQEVAPPEMPTARLVRSLGAGDYRQRRAAADSLTKLGEASIPALEEAAQSTDAETRLRAQELLTQLRSAQLWKAPVLSLSGSVPTVAGVLEELSRQSGNPLRLGDKYGELADGQLNVVRQRGTFWQFLDEICRTSGNRLRLSFDPRVSELVVAEGQTDLAPKAYAGPVRATIESARRVFIEDVDYTSGERETAHSFQLAMNMIWEDRLRLLAYHPQVELLNAVSDQGESISAPSVKPKAWQVLAPNDRQVQLNLMLDPPAVGVQQLETLQLGWELLAAGDFRTLEVDRLEAQTTLAQDDLHLEIEQVAHGPGPRCEVTLLLSRGLARPAPEAVLFHENRFGLIGKSGRAWTQQSISHSLESDGVRFRITFRGDDEADSAQTLRIEYPRVRSKRRLDIVFQAVPLPCQKPR